MTSYTVTCPSCHAANRIPADKEGKAGRCGSCHGALPPLYRHPQALSQSSFDPFVRAWPGPILAEFWAPW